MMGGGGGTNHRYNLTLSVMARNITNYLNVAQPNGTLPVPDLAVCSTSVANPCNQAPPFFGKSNSLSRGAFSSNGAPRLFYLQASFSF